MADEKSESEIEATEDESEEVLIPKSFFAGKDLEIGSKCEIKIEALYEDEASVSYVPHKKKKDKDKDSDDDDDSDDKPRRRRDRDDSDSMRDAMREFDAIAPAPAPAPGGYY